MQTNLDSRIGMLQTANGIVFYAYVNGYDKPETRGTLEQVEVALGLRKAPKKARKLRSYTVTVTPKFVAYAGGWKNEAYEAEFMSYDSNEAIKQAREEYNANNSGCGPATYRAKVNK